MEITLDKLRETYPAYVPSKGCLYVIVDAELVIIRDVQGVPYVYEGYVKDGLDPEGYRLGLELIGSFKDYFYHVNDARKKGMTPKQIIAGIYDEYGDTYPYWFNPDNPLTEATHG